VRFVLVAGEASGDRLGAALISALKARFPEAEFVGVGGAEMEAAGLDAWFGLDAFSVNGFVEPLLKLPSLLSRFFELKRRTISVRPACFIGIDFNVFNLLLAGTLKRQGIKTVHYVSPSVWAWRQGRIRRIKRNVDLMLCLYPFEIDIYRDHGIPCEFVGHPQARRLHGSSERVDWLPTKSTLTLACLPGSRRSEIASMMPLFAGTVSDLEHKGYDVHVLIPAPRESLRADIERLLPSTFGTRRVTLTVGDAEDVMRHADCVLVNAGTAALEAMLLGKPMVVVYQLGALTYRLVKTMVRLERFSLPNILSGEDLIEEFIQDAARPQAISEGILRALDHDTHERRLKVFDAIRADLSKPLEEGAVPAISALIE